MLFVAVFALLAASAVADSQSYSYSPPVGSGSGSSYSLTGTGRITAVRVWGDHIVRGFQFRYGFIWSQLAGFRQGTVQEIELFDGEAIIQISGTAGHYVELVVFTTNRGRTLSVGRWSSNAFNMYASHPEAELLLISGRVHGAITAIAGHWGIVASNRTSDSEH
ncbi:zymogen granule membrane protein 16 isoform X3 [Larimichthys crocea]|uniref:zymogen granule membrane protein 16 isoform X3 n=1 Tax=Larimichthys crocea TaxID=215358 RepID=UPI000F5EE33B|nr:zymogen granule membrane protein 16 isoform X3 [Larimichthys crocea]